MLIKKYFNIILNSYDCAVQFILNINIKNNYINIYTDNYHVFPCGRGNPGVDTHYKNIFLDFDNINITTYNYKNFMVNSALNITLNINNPLQNNIVFNFEQFLDNTEFVDNFDIISNIIRYLFLLINYNNEILLNKNIANELHTNEIIKINLINEINKLYIIIILLIILLFVIIIYKGTKGTKVIKNNIVSV